MLSKSMQPRGVCEGYTRDDKADNSARRCHTACIDSSRTGADEHG